MQKPFKFTAYNSVTKEEETFNDMMLAPYEFRMCRDNNWQVWENVRYDAQLRLYNYTNGIKPKLYFEGTEIGKSIPILNF